MLEKESMLTDLGIWNYYFKITVVQFKTKLLSPESYYYQQFWNCFDLIIISQMSCSKFFYVLSKLSKLKTELYDAERKQSVFVWTLENVICFPFQTRQFDAEPLLPDGGRQRTGHCTRTRQGRPQGPGQAAAGPQRRGGRPLHAEPHRPVRHRRHGRPRRTAAQVRAVLAEVAAHPLPGKYITNHFFLFS